MKEQAHYSDDPNHKARSDYWRAVRQYSPEADVLVKKPMFLLIRRQMRRPTQSGK